VTNEQLNTVLDVKFKLILLDEIILYLLHKYGVDESLLILLH